MPSPSCQPKAMARPDMPSECMPLELVAAMAMVRRTCGHEPAELSRRLDDPYTALHVAASVGVVHNLLPAMAGLLGELSLGSHAFPDHLARLSLAQQAIMAALPWLHPANVPAPLDQHVAKALAHAQEVQEAASMDAWLKLHGALKLAAVTLIGIAKDMRQQGSAGRHGHTPCDALTMVCAQVVGNDMALAGDETASQPTMAHRLLQSIRLLSDAITVFTEYFVRDIPHHRERISQGLASSLMLATSSLAP